MTRLIAVTTSGLRVGGDHQNAKLTDAEVEVIRRLNEGGMGYLRIAEKFEVSKSLVAMICRYERRACVIAGFRAR